MFKKRGLGSVMFLSIESYGLVMVRILPFPQEIKHPLETMDARNLHILGTIYDVFDIPEMEFPQLSNPKLPPPEIAKERKPGGIEAASAARLKISAASNKHTRKVMEIHGETMGN